jgi:hypothetical protein
MGHNPEHLNVGQHLRQKPTDASSLPGYSSGSKATSPDEVYEDLHVAEARRAPKAEGGRAFKTGEAEGNCLVRRGPGNHLFA